MKILFAVFVLAVSANVGAAVDHATGKYIVTNIVVAPVAETKQNITNRMERVVRVVSQSVMAGQLVSRMSDGSTVVEPLRRVATARVPKALARMRIERAMERVVAAGDAKNLEERAAVVEALAVEVEEASERRKIDPPPDEKETEKGAGGGRAVIVGGVLAALGAGAVGVHKLAKIGEVS